MNVKKVSKAAGALQCQVKQGGGAVFFEAAYFELTSTLKLGQFLQHFMKIDKFPFFALGSPNTTGTQLLTWDNNVPFLEYFMKIDNFFALESPTTT